MVRSRSNHGWSDCVLLLLAPRAVQWIGVTGRFCLILFLPSFLLPFSALLWSWRNCVLRCDLLPPFFFPCCAVDGGHWALLFDSFLPSFFPPALYSDPLTILQGLE